MRVTWELKGNNDGKISLHSPRLIMSMPISILLVES